MNQNHTKSICQNLDIELLRLFDEGDIQQLPADIQAHLDACPDCRTSWEKLVLLSRGLEQIDETMPGEAYWNNYLPRLRQKMGGESGTIRKRNRAWVPALGLALLFLALVLKSPVLMAPPDWYSNSSDSIISDVIYGDYYAGSIDYTYDLDAETLATLQTDATDTLSYYIISKFSEIDIYQSSDIYDQLNDLDEEVQEYFLEALASRPIIQS